MPEIKPTEHSSPQREANAPSFHQLPKEEIIVLLKKTAKQLGKVPSFMQFRRLAGATPNPISRLFGGYTELLQAAGFEPLGSGYQVSMQDLFNDWARVTRKLGTIPSKAQYVVTGKYSESPFNHRWPSWRRVPAAMIDYAASNRLMGKWGDVMKLAKKHAEEEKKAAKRRNRRKAMRAESAQRVMPKRELRTAYGNPMMHPAMMTTPVNEAGVMVLFGAMAVRLGFSILHLQADFPDCEALRLCRDGRWRWVRIEFEFESRNFQVHGHDKNRCDLIVCWKHNWPKCSLEVIELSKLVGSNSGEHR